MRRSAPRGDGSSGKSISRTGRTNEHGVPKVAINEGENDTLISY